MALPVGKNISIYQGDSFELAFTLYTKLPNGDQGPAVDLTGATASAEMRATVDSSTVLATFTCSHDDDGGRITCALSPAQTEALPASGGVWDVQVEYPNGDVKTYLAGTVAVTKEVTRV